jgi:hypothetical protein
MSGFYVSTSRKPSVLTRRLARWLSILTGGETENRGKRGVAELSQRALEKGYPYVLIVHEDHGNPAQLCFLEDGQMIAVANVGIASLPNSPQGGTGIPRSASLGRRVQSTGARGKLIGKFLALGLQDSEKPGARVLEVLVTDSRISFGIAGKSVGPVLSIISVKEYEVARPDEAEEEADNGL